MQFNEKKSIDHLVENISKSSNKNQKSKLQPHKGNKKEQIIHNYDFFLKNEIDTNEILKNTNKTNINQRYYLLESFSPLKIGEINQEQSHLENYTPLNISINPLSYVLVTYPYSRKLYPTFETFFSRIIESKTFFHYFFSSYFYLADSLIELNEKGIYPIKFNQKTIFFNREKLPILSLPLTFHQENNFLETIHHLSKEDFDNLFPFSLFENKTKEEMRNECIMIMPNINNYQLSLLYLKQIDKIMEETNHYQYQYPLIEKVRECFQNVVFADHKKREKLQETKEKIENLFL
jgi:predicted ATP-dependent protease